VAEVLFAVLAFSALPLTAACLDVEAAVSLRFVSLFVLSEAIVSSSSVVSVALKAALRTVDFFWGWV